MILLKQILTEALDWKQCAGWNSTGESHWDGTDGRPKIVIDKTTDSFKLTYTGKLSGFYISSAKRGAKDSIHQAFNVMACECNDFLNSNPGIKPDIDNIKTLCTYNVTTNYTLQIIIPFINVGYGKWQINRRGSWGGTPDTSTLPVASNYYEFYPTDKKYVTNVTEIPNDSVFGKITEYFVTYNTDTTSAIQHQNTDKSKPNKDKQNNNSSANNTDDAELDTDILFGSEAEEIPGTEKDIITFKKLKEAGFKSWYIDLETGNEISQGDINSSDQFNTKNRIIAHGPDRNILKQQILDLAKQKFKSNYPKIQLFWRQNKKSQKGKFTVVCLLSIFSKQLKQIQIKRTKILPTVAGNTWADYQANGWKQFSWDTNKLLPDTKIIASINKDLLIDLRTDSTRTASRRLANISMESDLSTLYYDRLDDNDWSQREIRKAGGHLVYKRESEKLAPVYWIIFEDDPKYAERQQKFKLNDSGKS